MTRKEAREEAFLLLFEQSFGANETEDTLALAAEARDMKISGFGKGLYLGTVENLSDIDTVVEKALIGWSGERVSRVVRTALRLCTYELKYTELDTEIAINEAVELVKKFDGEESASYANGVLGSVAASVKSGDAQ